MKIANKPTHKTLKHYQNSINALTRRRNEIRVRLMNDYEWNGYTGVASNKQLISKAYAVSIKGMTEEIENLKHNYRNLQTKQKEVRKIGAKVEEFFNIKLKQGKILEKRPFEIVELARWILSKYILELGVGLNGRHIANYLECRIGNPSAWRTKLTRSFETNPSNKRKWDEFNTFIKS